MSYEKVRQAKERTVGTKQTLKALEQGVVSEVFIASDADKRITAKVEELCRQKDIPINYVDSMRLLGKACGIDVGAAIAAIKHPSS
ncbi:50S ribosomal protein L7ae-like protein [Bacillaceae bacterium]